VYNTRQLNHSLKVGVALVLVSLLYLVDSLYEKVGENAMWAIMTVVVIFEFSAGATLSKGLNRGIGTILGGLLGCLAATLADQIGGAGEAIAVGVSIFIFGVAASYIRLIPAFKKKFDYGAMIFILTFNLVIVSGIRDMKIFDLARDRLLTIGIGFGICILASLLIFPVWSSDELHSSTVSKFHSIASSIEGCFEVYFNSIDEKDTKKTATQNGYKSVLHSKSSDEILEKFARWEPWHGKFGFYHPWDKYLDIGEQLRELAVSNHSLKECLQSPRQPSSKSLKLSIKAPCEAVASLLTTTLRESGESIDKMKVSRSGASLVAKLQKTKLELSTAISASELGELSNDEGIAVASSVFLLMEMVDKVEVLAKYVEQLGDLAGFPSH
ncbi:Aluminum-activated malate transporter, partial [Thalictrum thalictroides]